MKKRNKFFIVSSSLLSLIISFKAEAMWCNYVVQDPVWKGNAQQNVAKVNAHFDHQLSASSELITAYFQQLISAAKIQASQKALDSQRNSIGINKSLQAYAQAVNQQQISEQILQAQKQFGNESQIASSCNATKALGDVVSAMSNNKDIAKTIITPNKISSAPGSTVTGREALNKRIQKHTSYCSQDEVNAGLCSNIGSKPSADVMASTFFDPTSSDEDVSAYINNLVGDPLTKPTAQEAKTPEGALKLTEAVRVEALRSPALNSLAVLRAEVKNGSGNSLSNGGNSVSVVQALDNIVQTYGGGPKYQEWDAQVSATNEAGVLRELIKLKALEMKLRSYQTESSTRIGAIISTLLAAEAQ